MKLVAMILTVLSLTACHVEGPEAGEAKIKPKKNKPDMPNPLEGILWLEADAVQGLYSPLLMAWRVDHKKKKFSIRPVIYKDYGHKVPRGADDCVDHYNNITADDTDLSTITYEGSKGGKSIKITIYQFGTDKGKARHIEYTVLDEDGDSVTYKEKEKRSLTRKEKIELPLQHSLDKGRVPFDEFFNDDHPDCDHVSQSSSGDS